MSQGSLSTKRVVNRGVALVEVILGASIISMIIGAMFFGVTLMVEIRDRIITQNIALYKAEEGIELVRFLRDDAWANISGLSVDTTYYLAVTTTTIASSVTPEVDGVYSRQFILREVHRDFAYDYTVASTTSGAYVDGGARWVEVSVGHPYGTTTLAALITDIF